MTDLNYWEHDLNGAIIFILGISGLILNGMLVLKLARRQMRSNVLLINLILANFGIIVFVFPLSCFSSFKHEWAFGEGGCSYYGVSAMLFGFNIMVTVVMIVLDAFFQSQFRQYDAFKLRVRKIMVAWSWINSIIWSITPLVGWSRISYELFNTSCTVDYQHPDGGYVSYIIICFVTCYVIPIVLMVFCKLKIKNEKDFHPVEPAEPNNTNRRIILLIAFFVAEWTIYAIVYMWPVFGDPQYMPVRLAAAGPLLAKFSVVTLPMVFTMC